MSNLQIIWKGPFQGIYFLLSASWAWVFFWLGDVFGFFGGGRGVWVFCLDGFGVFWWVFCRELLVPLSWVILLPGREKKIGAVDIILLFLTPTPN